MKSLVCMNYHLFPIDFQKKWSLGSQPNFLAASLVKYFPFFWPRLQFFPGPTFFLASIFSFEFGLLPQFGPLFPHPGKEFSTLWTTAQPASMSNLPKRECKLREGEIFESTWIFPKCFFPAIFSHCTFPMPFSAKRIHEAPSKAMDIVHLVQGGQTTDDGWNSCHTHEISIFQMVLCTTHTAIGRGLPTFNGNWFCKSSIFVNICGFRGGVGAFFQKESELHIFQTTHGSFGQKEMTPFLLF